MAGARPLFMTPAPWSNMAKAQTPEDPLGLLQTPDMAAQPTGAQPVQTAQSQTVELPPPPRAQKDTLGSWSTSTRSLGPGAEPHLRKIDELTAQYNQAAQEAKASQQAGIDDLQGSINKYEQAKRGIDWRPLAALLDQWSGGGNLYKMASDLAPESEQQKREKIMALKQQLQNNKSSMSKEQRDYLRAQLDAELGIIKEMSAERRLQASLSGKDDRQARLRERDVDKDVQAYERAIRDKAGVQGAIDPIESALGFKFEAYDENTGTVNGIKVDAPGVKIPGLAAVYQGTAEGERFRARIHALLSQVRKSYAGTAVTESEAAELMKMFANNPGSVRQSSFIAALKDYKRLLQEEIDRRAGGFEPQVIEKYEANLSSKRSKTEQERKANAGLSAPAGADLAGAAAAELARRKAGK